jgi:acyl-coenzyme A synthetase/AMP-(fatty) acid ligase
MATAYGQPNPITGQIVALDVVLATGADQDSVKAAIRDAAATLPRAARPRKIRFVDALEIRGSKVLRREAKA